MKCYNHPDRDAEFQCISCQLAVCRECVKSFQAGGFFTYFCPGCNSQCDDLPVPSKNKTAAKKPKTSPPPPKKAEPLKKPQQTASKPDPSSTRSPLRRQSGLKMGVDGSIDGKLSAKTTSKTSKSSPRPKPAAPPSPAEKKPGTPKPPPAPGDEAAAPDLPSSEGKISAMETGEIDLEALKPIVMDNEELAKSREKALAELEPPSIFASFFKTLLSPENAFSNAIFQLHRSVPFRIKYLGAAFLLFIITAAVKTQSFPWLFSTAGTFLELALLSGFLALGASLIGNMESPGYSGIFFFGTAVFLHLLQHLVLIPIPPGIAVLAVAGIFFAVKLWIFSAALHKCFRCRVAGSVLLFLVATAAGASSGILFI